MQIDTSIQEDNRVPTVQQQRALLLRLKQAMGVLSSCLQESGAEAQGQHHHSAPYMHSVPMDTATSTQVVELFKLIRGAVEDDGGSETPSEASDKHTAFPFFV